VEFERKGNPNDSRREDELDVELAAALSLAAFSLPRFPYLFFRYLAQELRAAPSFSPDPAPVVKKIYVIIIAKVKCSYNASTQDNFTKMFSKKYPKKKNACPNV